MLDALDVEILEALQTDGRASHRTIAARVASTQPTVTARIKRMEAAGIIKGYQVVLDEAAFQGAPNVGALVACHWCHKRSPDPIWNNVGGKDHPFCCTSCRALYIEKDAKMREGL